MQVLAAQNVCFWDITQMLEVEWTKNREKNLLSFSLMWEAFIWKRMLRDEISPPKDANDAANENLEQNRELKKLLREFVGEPLLQLFRVC